MSQVERIHARKVNRGSTPNYLLSFLKNFAASAKLMHASLRAFQDDHGLLQEAIRQYMIGMTSCLETYFRDLYLTILDADRELLARLFDGDKRAARLARMRVSENDEISDSEIAAELVKFQNLSGIDQALSEVLRTVRYIDALNNEPFLCVIPSRRCEPTSLKLWPEWRGHFASIFDRRHEFVHDANKSCAVRGTEMAAMEAVALIVPQLTAFLLAQHLGPSMPMLAIDSRLPAVLLVEDLIANDWQVAKDESS